MATNPDLIQLLATGLFGRLQQGDVASLTFERTPLLLSKNEGAAAAAGRAVWLDEPGGWFATDESDVNALVEWMPEYVAPYFFLASNQQRCWKCGRATSVVCLASKGGYLARHSLDEDEADDVEDAEQVAWSIADSGTFIGNLTLVNGRVRRFLAENCPNYRVDFSKMAESSYFMNHCDYCDAKFGDFFMHNEPGGAFFPTTEHEASFIRMRRVDMPLLVQGSASITTPDLVPFCSVFN
ncbi:hypothetical protein [Caballeronia mineralivorans]|uniref:hypothetical protein n=1 Tax=Caballeronia mineralivorans TaxID=2010198 RepID=UPI00069F80DB|nr:hypothetical protein [Caballeronia mineralivorans]